MARNFIDKKYKMNQVHGNGQNFQNGHHKQNHPPQKYIGFDDTILCQDRVSYNNVQGFIQYFPHRRANGFVVYEQRQNFYSVSEPTLRQAPSQTAINSPVINHNNNYTLNACSPSFNFYSEYQPYPEQEYLYEVLNRPRVYYNKMLEEQEDDLNIGFNVIGCYCTSNVYFDYER